MNKKLMALVLSMAVILLIDAGKVRGEIEPGKNEKEAYTVNINQELSHENECLVRPTFYSTRRARSIQNPQKIREIPGDGFSAGSIKKQRDLEEYGLYLKFTPGITDNGFPIWKFDYIVIDPSGNAVYTKENEADWDLKYGKAWAYEFLSLDYMFSELIDYYGSIPKGVYTIDIYFNEQYAGRTQFRVRD